MANVRNQKNKNALNLFLREYAPALMAAVLVVCLLLSYILLLAPKFAAAKAGIRANLESEQKLYLNSLRKLAVYRAIDQVYQQINPNDLQRFNGVLPDDYVPERLFGEVEEMAAQGGWLISSLTISEPKADETPPGVVRPGLGRYNLELSIASIDYSGLKKLLKIFENNLRLFDVTEVNFSPSEATADIILTTYYYQAP
ncbi:MAG: hypothetical protein WC453_00830 [Patescibacteria group bacterium]